MKRKLSSWPKLDANTKKWRVKCFDGFEDYNDAEDACRAQLVASAEAQELHGLDALLKSWAESFKSKIIKHRQEGRIMFSLPAVSAVLLGRLKDRCMQM